ncbi:hypothetical protein [Azospirillum halopraeferens]|uniref:hypothetical protein n=1 Tax=Azospirillum halopraeferens TaxID=34010 RepID=UPI0003F6E707|nr:hypothetical protein [Azospirillum halopraeferens]
MMALPASVRAACAALLVSAAAFAGWAGPIHPSFAAEPAAGAGTRFVAGMGDVPVMPGLEPTGVEPLVFDKPSGRIVEAVLSGAVAPDAVRTFYARTLPQLGWRRRADGHFLREGEELRLEFPKAGGGRTMVRLVLIPE